MTEFILTCTYALYMYCWEGVSKTFFGKFLSHTIRWNHFTRKTWSQTYHLFLPRVIQWVEKISYLVPREHFFATVSTSAKLDQLKAEVKDCDSLAFACSPLHHILKRKQILHSMLAQAFPSILWEAKRSYKIMPWRPSIQRAWYLYRFFVTEDQNPEKFNHFPRLLYPNSQLLLLIKPPNKIF